MAPTILLTLALAGHPQADVPTNAPATATIRPQRATSGLFNVISKTTSHSKQQRQAKTSSKETLAGGASDFGGLIRLIETTVAPDSWDYSNSSPSAAPDGTASSGAQQLADLIQKEVQPLSWDINGGLGSIGFLGN